MALQRTELVERLLALFQAEQAKGPEGSTDALRARIAGVVDAALPEQAHHHVDSRRVTILLSDLRGFTQVAEKYTALQMVEALNRYFERMSAIIVRHGGTIDKFMGDAIMALFGAPLQREGDADLAAALACAIEMQLAMADINTDNEALGMAPLYMGIGINTGEVVAGHMGSDLHSEYTVIGDQVNLASRVEAHSLRGQILLSENTYLLAKDFIRTGDANEVKVKGKKWAVRMYELLATDKPVPLTAPKREARNSPRVEVDLPLTFQVLAGKLVLGQVHVGRVIDLSYGGMYVYSPVQLVPFSDIKITLSLTLLGTEATEIYAKVLRVAEVDGLWECRLEFTSIDVSASQAIKEFVDGIVELDRP